MKRFFIMLTALLMSMGAFAQSSAIQGDVNNDGKVDVADIVKVIDIMQQGSSEPGDEEEYYWYLGITDPYEYADNLFDESTIDNTFRSEYNSDINIGWRGWHKVEYNDFDEYDASHPLWSSRNGDTYLPNDVIWYIALPCKTANSRKIKFKIYNELGSVAIGGEWSLMSDTPIKVGSGYCFIYEKIAPSQRLAHCIY